MPSGPASDGSGPRSAHFLHAPCQRQQAPGCCETNHDDDRRRPTDHSRSPRMTTDVAERAAPCGLRRHEGCVMLVCRQPARGDDDAARLGRGGIVVHGRVPARGRRGGHVTRRVGASWRDAGADPWPLPAAEHPRPAAQRAVVAKDGPDGSADHVTSVRCPAIVDRRRPAAAREERGSASSPGDHRRQPEIVGRFDDHR